MGVYLILNNRPDNWNMQLTSIGIVIGFLLFSGLLVTGYRRLSVHTTN